MAIKKSDLDTPDNALAAYQQVLPGLRATLFESAGRSGYARLKPALPEVKLAIFGYAEFIAFNQIATKRLADWRKATTLHPTGFGKDGHPKAVIETIAESRLAGKVEVHRKKMGFQP